MPAQARVKPQKIVKYTPAVIDRAVKALARASWKKGDPTYLLTDGQLELVNGLERARLERVRHTVFQCSRRWGKSWTMCIYAIKMCLQRPGFKVQYVGGQKSDMQRIIKPTFRDVFSHCPEEFGHHLPKWNQYMGAYEFPNGSTLILGAANNNNIDDLRGQAADLIIIDEAGYIGPLDEAINSVLGPMLATTKGTMVIASTPPRDPAHYFYQIAARAKVNGFLFHRDVYSIDIPAPRNVDPEEERKNCLSESVWKREYLALPAMDEDYTVFYEFTELEKELVKAFVRPPYFNYYSRYITLDYGFSPDATGILFAYYDYKAATLYIEDEILIQRMNTKTLADAVTSKKKELWPELEVHKQVMDGVKVTQEDLWSLHRLDFQMVEKGPGSVEQNANNTNMMLRDRRIIIHPRCKNLIAQMQVAQWAKFKKSSSKRELARSTMFQHYDLVAALFYMVRSLDLNHNPIPKLPYYDPLTHVVAPHLLKSNAEVPEASDDTTDVLRDFFAQQMQR
jgi:Terminase large subunit, T4likevirus-type, N-terminal